MSIRRAILTALGTALLLGASPAAGQPYSVWRYQPSPWPSTTRSLDGFYGQYRLDVGDGARVVLGGVGGRLAWTPRPTLGEPGGLAARTALGAFAFYAPRPAGVGSALLHSGAELSVRPLARPALGRLVPEVALGAGALRADVDAPTPHGAAARRSTDFALSPSAGLRIALRGTAGLRGDVRDVMTFRGGTTRHTVGFTTGLGFTF